ncbi:hypothetical protein GGS21DRAFT_162377 [Xylaria nigripes]|nr:hypothetical protein GGS21DRAFT_162377 [Xylaria nigripes]
MGIPCSRTSGYICDNIVQSTTFFALFRFSFFLAFTPPQNSTMTGIRIFIKTASPCLGLVLVFELLTAYQLQREEVVHFFASSVMIHALQFL